MGLYAGDAGAAQVGKQGKRNRIQVGYSQYAGARVKKGALSVARSKKNV